VVIQQVGCTFGTERQVTLKQLFKHMKDKYTKWLFTKEKFEDIRGVIRRYQRA
jgi:hypothetical protein